MQVSYWVNPGWVKQHCPMIQVTEECELGVRTSLKFTGDVIISAARRHRSRAASNG